MPVVISITSRRIKYVVPEVAGTLRRILRRMVESVVCIAGIGDGSVIAVRPTSIKPSILNACSLMSNVRP